MPIERLALVSRYGRFVSGVERYLHDLALELRARGVECGLVYAEGGEGESDYLSAFTWFEQLDFMNIAERETHDAWLAVVERRRPQTAYLHKVEPAPAQRAFGGPVRALRMVHDHEPYCLTTVKYFHLHTQALCNRPVAMGCYPRCLGLRRRGGGGVGPRWLTIESVRDRRQRLAATSAMATVVVASDYMREQLVLNGVPRAKIEVLPLFTRAVEAPSAYPATARRVLFVGRLHREKGVDHLLQALARLKGSFSAQIIGDGKREAALRLARKLGLESRVEIFGAMTAGDVDRAYREASVVVMPVKWPEPFGMVGLEAMAHARPVVAYRAGGIPEWLIDGDTGFLVERLDVAALTAAVQRILDDPALGSRLGEAGRARVLREPFQPAHHCRRLLELLAAESPSAGRTVPALDVAEVGSRLRAHPA